jgi:hypothetical protein
LFERTDSDKASETREKTARFTGSSRFLAVSRSWEASTDHWRTAMTILPIVVRREDGQLMIRFGSCAVARTTLKTNLGCGRRSNSRAGGCKRTPKIGGIWRVCGVCLARSSDPARKRRKSRDGTNLQNCRKLFRRLATSAWESWYD